MAAAASAAGWQYFLDESTGYHYWWHPESGESQWDATEEASEADAAAGTPQALWGTGAGGSGASDEEDVSGSSDSDEEQVERPRAASAEDAPPLSRPARREKKRRERRRRHGGCNVDVLPSARSVG